MLPILFLSVGPFGQGVLRCLKMLRSDILETKVDSSLNPETWPAGRIYVVVAWRPVSHLCELVDELSHANKRPFIPFIAEGRHLRLGPVVVPGEGSCWSCWVRRSRQHDLSARQRLAIWKHYTANPRSGPRGFLEPFAVIAAAKIASTVDGLESGHDVAGHIWQIDVLTRRIVTGTTVSTHGCGRCGLNRSSSERSYAEMRRALTHLWQS